MRYVLTKCRYSISRNSNRARHEHRLRHMGIIWGVSRRPTIQFRVHSSTSENFIWDTYRVERVTKNYHRWFGQINESFAYAKFSTEKWICQKNARAEFPQRQIKLWIRTTSSNLDSDHAFFNKRFFRGQITKILTSLKRK